MSTSLISVNSSPDSFGHWRSRRSGRSSFLFDKSIIQGLATINISPFIHEHIFPLALWPEQDLCATWALWTVLWHHSYFGAHNHYPGRFSLEPRFTTPILHADTENSMTEFGGLLSTSNEIVGDSAVVAADKHILWTIEFRSRGMAVME